MIRDLKIDKTELTPHVELLQNGCDIILKGECLPEDTRTFFKPILEWVEGIEPYAPDKITLHLSLPYFNSSSSKQLLKLFYLLENYKESNTSVDTIVNWYYPEGDDLILEK